jgi:hypothetical protein
LIANQIKKSSTLAYDRFEKFVKKIMLDEWKSMSMQIKSDKPVNLVKSYLIKGYEKYLKLLQNGKAIVKTSGLDTSQQVWQFFISSELFDQSVESKLQELTMNLKQSLIQVSGIEMFSELASKFSLVLDISRSMIGAPIETGLLYMVLMTKVFQIKKLYYFESNLKFIDITEEELAGTMCRLVKKIYKYSSGSTQLKSVFEHFKKENIRDKNVIIITDGDCDPINSYDYKNQSANPFHSAPRSSHGLKYIVINVKETKMNFPYLNMDPDVCYVSGRNPKIMTGLFKALIKSLVDNVLLTPSLVLKCSLDLDELKHDFTLGIFRKIYNSDEITKIHQIFIKNIPKQKAQHSNSEFNKSANLKQFSDLDLDLDLDSDPDQKSDLDSDSD